MKQSEDIKDLVVALVEAHKSFPNLQKDAKGYGYTYAKLETIISVVMPILTHNGLSIIQLPSGESDKGITIVTQLVHISGQWMRDSFFMPAVASKGINIAQAYGSASTYARRYALASLLSLSIGADDDGVTAAPKVDEGQHERQRRQRVIDAFIKKGVTKEMLDANLHHDALEATEEEIKTLQIMYDSLKSGKNVILDYFEGAIIDTAPIPSKFE